MKVRLLVLALVIACAPKTPLLTDRPQGPGHTYFFSTLSKREGRAVERLVPDGAVVTRQAKTKRKWMYLINDPGVAGLPRYDFAPLTKCEVTVRLERHSDSQGLGVNAGNVRKMETVVLAFEGPKVSEAILLLQALATDPFAAAKTHAPDAWKTVAQETAVDELESGFVVKAHAELVTGNPFDTPSRVTIYQLDATSPYQRARAADSPP